MNIEQILEENRQLKSLILRDAVGKFEDLVYWLSASEENRMLFMTHVPKCEIDRLKEALNII